MLCHAMPLAPVLRERKIRNQGLTTSQSRARVLRAFGPARHLRIQITAISLGFTLGKGT